MATLRYFVDRACRGGRPPPAFRTPAFVRTAASTIFDRFGGGGGGGGGAQRPDDLQRLSRFVGQQADVLGELAKTERWTDDTTAEVRDVAQALLDRADADLRRHNPPLL